MNDLEFASVEALLLLAVAVPVALLAWWRSPRAYAIPSSLGFEGARRSLRSTLAGLLPVLRILAVAFLVLGLARPRIGQADAVIQAEGIDIVLALDISSSMSSGRFVNGETRLEATRQVVREFIQGLENDRVGVVVFQEDALPLSPPSLDYDALDSIIATLESGLLRDGTGVGVGLAAALNMLQESSAASRIIILLTDGEQNADSIAPLEATSLASALNIRVYTIGVGPEAQPGRFGGIDVALLQEIADRTGARYFNPESAEDLADVYTEISSLETSRIGRDRFADYDEFGPLLLGIAAALVLAELLLRATWLRRLPA